VHSAQSAEKVDNVFWREEICKRYDDAYKRVEELDFPKVLPNKKVVGIYSPYGQLRREETEYCGNYWI
jgi:hypothetical protein